MVMDVWDHCPPRGNPYGQIYMLDVYLNDEEPLQDHVKLIGVFTHLEAALHAMDHFAKYKYRDIEIGQSLVVTSVPIDKIRKRINFLVSWKRGEDDTKRLGCGTGAFELHSGLRTSPVES